MFDAYLERVGVKNLFNFSITIIVMLLVVIYVLTMFLGDAKQSCDNYYKQKVEDFIHAQSSCIYGSERYNASAWSFPGAPIGGSNAS